jgi:hypothetical protein
MHDGNDMKTDSFDYTICLWISLLFYLIENFLSGQCLMRMCSELKEVQQIDEGIKENSMLPFTINHHHTEFTQFSFWGGEGLFLQIIF